MSVPAGIMTPISTTPVTSADSEKPNPAQTRLQEGQYEVTVPVLMDRCHQQRVRHALEPEWEARFEPRVRHEAHCCIARAAGRDERRYLWI